MEPVFSARKFIIPLSNCFSFFFIWRIIAWYNVVTVSALYLHESAIGIRMPLPLEPPSNLPPHPTPLGCHRAPALGSLHHTANFHWLSLLHLVMFMFQCICFNATLSNHPTLSFPHCDHKSVLYVSDVWLFSECICYCLLEILNVLC